MKEETAVDNSVAQLFLGPEMFEPQVGLVLKLGLVLSPFWLFWAQYGP